MVSLFLVLRNSYSFHKKYEYLFYLFLLFLFYLVRFENLTFSFNFTSEKILEMATIYGFDYDRSSAYEYLTSAAGSNYLVYSVFSLFSSFAFFINRSELWGLFFARYNPNIQEPMFGTGPFSLNHYSEIDIVSLRVNTGDPLGFYFPILQCCFVYLFLII